MISFKKVVTLTVALCLGAGCGSDPSSGDDDTGTGTETSGDADADTDADSDADADTDSDTDTDADSDSDADTDADTDADSDTDSDGDTDADSDTDTDADGDTDTGDAGSDAGFDAGPGDPCDPNPCTGDAGPCAVEACRDVDGGATCVAVSACGCDKAVCETPDECACSDLDGDGLADAWETSDSGPSSTPPNTPYIDNSCNGQWDPGEALLEGAEVNKPDIYVYYDWMDWSPPGNRCPVGFTCPALGSGHAGETCEGGLCAYACDDTTDCTSRGVGHVAEQCLFSPEAGMDVCQHTHDPEIVAPGALQAVVDAFALRGFNLHVVRGAAKPHSLVTSFRTDEVMTDACEGASGANAGLGKYAVSLYTLKAGGGTAVFPTEAAAVLHYTAFVHYSSCDSNAHCKNCPEALNPDGSPKNWPSPGMQTGIAEISGNDFIVSLGGRLQDVNLSAWNTVTGLSSVSTVFMHELGHNLGIHHGGGIDTPCSIDADCPASVTCTPTAVGKLCLMASEDNYKVNYLSLMNYRFVFTGIQSSTTIGDPSPTSARLDYSTQALPTGGNTPGALDERASPHPGMDEDAGLGSGTSDTFTFVDAVNCAHERNSEDWFGTIGASDGPVDFDGDGATTSTDVSSEISWYGSGGALCGEDAAYLRYLKGFQDWPTMWSGPDSVSFTYEFQCTPYYGDGPGPLEGMTTEPSIDELVALHLADPVIPARIDIRPGCATNGIDLGSEADVTAVVFGSNALDVRRIKTDEMILAGGEPSGFEYADFDNDGRIDLKLHVPAAELRLGPSSEMATFTAVLDNEQLVFGADRVEVGPGEKACAPCAGWSGGVKRAGCWYVGAAGRSCESVCAGHGGIDWQAWAHEGNPVCKIFFPEKRNGGNTGPIECCSADTAYGANGEKPCPHFTDPACALACACRH
jgi:hypothetical protein